MSSSTTSTFNDACAVLPFSMTLHPVRWRAPRRRLQPDASPPFKAYILVSAMDRVRRKRWSSWRKDGYIFPRRCRTACNRTAHCVTDTPASGRPDAPGHDATGAGKPGTGPGRQACATAPRSGMRHVRRALRGKRRHCSKSRRASRRKSTSSPASARNTKPGSSDAKPFCARLRRAFIDIYARMRPDAAAAQPRRHGQRNRQRRDREAQSASRPAPFSNEMEPGRAAMLTAHSRRVGSQPGERPMKDPHCSDGGTSPPPFCLPGCARRFFPEIGREPGMTPVGSGLTAYHASLPAGGSFPDEGQRSYHSLWKDNRENLFADARALKVGDVVTVRIRMADQARLNTETGRSRDSGANFGFGFRRQFRWRRLQRQSRRRCQLRQQSRAARARSTAPSASMSTLPPSSPTCCPTAT